MKKQLYTALSLVLLLSASFALKAEDQESLLALAPSTTASSPQETTPLLGGMRYNDLTDKFTVDAASLTSTMNAKHKVMGLQILSLQDNPMTGYIALDGQKIVDYTLVRAIPEDDSAVALGLLNNYYLVISSDDFEKLYQAKLIVITEEIKDSLSKDWKQKKQGFGAAVAKRLGSWLEGFGKKIQGNSQ